MAPARGDLLAHVARDLEGCDLRRVSAKTAIVTPSDGRPSFEVEVLRERRRLLDLQTLAIHVHGPATSARDVTIVLRHRGQVRRRGLEAVLRGRERDTGAELRERLLGGGDLETASLALDFTRFKVHPHEGSWRATLELMGASHVRTTFPPSAKYVRLDDEQVEALVATVAVLHERLPGRWVQPSLGGPDPAANGTQPTPSRTRAASSERHLPHRSA